MGDLGCCSQWMCATACGLLVLGWSNAARPAEPPIELGAYAGYEWGGSLDARSGDETRHVDIGDAPTFAATLDFATSRDSRAELGYSHMETSITTRSSRGTVQHYDLATNYFGFGGLLELRVPGADWLRPLVGGTIGPTLFEADGNDVSFHEWRATLALEGGFKLRIIDHLGVRLRARLLTTIFTDHSALFCGGTSCAFSFSGTALFQGEMGGGVYVAF